MVAERIPQGGALAVYDPFQSVLNQVRAGQVPHQLGDIAGGAANAARGVANAAASRGGRLASGAALPALAGGASILQGQVMQGLGEIGGGLAGGGLAGIVASGLEKGGAKGKLLGAGVRAVGGLLGGAIGGAVGKGVGDIASGGAQALSSAASNAVTNAVQTQMGQGVSPGMIPGVGGVGIGFSDKDVARIAELSRVTGQSQIDIARQMLPIANQFQNAQLQRAMQLAQQTGQITGALNRQLYTAELAKGAQAEAGATTREMLTAQNPYAASAFQARG